MGKIIHKNAMGEHLMTDDSTQPDTITVKALQQKSTGRWWEISFGTDGDIIFSTSNKPYLLREDFTEEEIWKQIREDAELVTIECRIIKTGE